MFLLMLISCGWMLDKAASDGLATDIGTLLDGAGADYSGLKCDTLSSPRQGWCTVRLNDTADVVSQIGMRPISRDQLDRAAAPPKGCTAREGFEQGAPLSIWAIDRRGLTGWETLVMYRVVGSNRICFDATYAFG